MRAEESELTGAATRYLYLVRHAAASADGSALSENGRRQATLLGRRLQDVPFAAFHHGPLPRAEQTAQLIGEYLKGVTPRVTDVAGDYVPWLPAKEELPADSADYYLGFLAGVTDEEAREGQALARQALERFTGPADGEEDRHELVVTHNFLVAWLVREALHAPRWRWLGLNYGNAALTVIRYAPGRAPSVLVANDMRHLPAELRWTGYPPEVHV